MGKIYVSGFDPAWTKIENGFDEAAVKPTREILEKVELCGPEDKKKNFVWNQTGVFKEKISYIIRPGHARW